VQIFNTNISGARDWERRATNIPGVFLLKLPSSRTRQAAVGMEINPVDAVGLVVTQSIQGLSKGLEPI
jgi:hypothetical protein